MKKYFRKFMFFLLAFGMIIMSANIASFADVTAADGQDVITGAESDIYSVSLSDKTITVTVPYKFADTVNANHITPIWDASIQEQGIYWSGDYQTLSIGNSVNGIASYKVGGSDKVYKTTYKLTVKKAEKVDAYAEGSIIKSVAAGTTTKLNASDITSKYKKNDGEVLDHIVITKKSDSTAEGEFTVNGSKYSLGDKILYADISAISFMPNKSGLNEYTIYYYESGNKNSAGTVNFSINVANVVIDSIDAGKIKKTETLKFPIDLVNSNFKAASKSLNDFSKIVFTKLPDSGLGSLYENYVSKSNQGTALVANKEYPISYFFNSITFVPGTTTGEAVFEYTIYDSNNQKYDGKVKITVTEENTASENKTLPALSYSIYNDKTWRLSTSDLNSNFKSISFSDLSYVCFEVPDSKYGKLYYKYNSESDKGPEVSSSVKYYYTGNNVKLLLNIVFVPSTSYTGTVQLKYTAYASDNANTAYTGTININVNKSQSEVMSTNSKYFSDVDQSYNWAVEKIDYLYERGIVKGSVLLNGKLGYSPSDKITRGDFILMIYRAFKLEAASGSNFLDVPSDSYYYDAIGVAKSLGIAQGAYGNFNPNSSLTREDAMVLLYRTIAATGNKTLTQSTDVSKFKDSKDISSYATNAVGTLVKAGIINGYSDGTFMPKGNLTRAEMAVVLYNVDKM